MNKRMRYLELPGDLTYENCQEFRQGLFDILCENDDQPVVVFCDSHGGKGGIIAQTMLNLPKVKFITVVSAHAYSWAVGIFACGEERLICRNAILGLHSIRAHLEGNFKPEDLALQAESCQAAQQMYARVVKQRTGFVLKREHCQYEIKDMAAAQAVKFGLATKVIRDISAAFKTMAPDVG